MAVGTGVLVHVCREKAYGSNPPRLSARRGEAPEVPKGRRRRDTVGGTQTRGKRPESGIERSFGLGGRCIIEGAGAWLIRSLVNSLGIRVDSDRKPQAAKTDCGHRRGD